MENSLNDGYFIEAVIRHLAQGTRLREHLANGWLQFENAGGCANVGNFIEGKMQSYNTLPKEKHVYLRCYVIVDSDKKHPAEPRKHEYDLLIAKYGHFNIPIHILEKRSMENYLPIEAYPFLTRYMSQVFIDAFRSMTPIQIDFYNLQHGFEGKTRALLDVTVAAHYATVSDANLAILANGSGVGNFKSEFPKFMTNHGVHRQSLISRTAHQNDPQELENIIKAIEKLL
ncbi:hypothetical protein [Mucilaginibacter pineti]|uniref:hypothetical protein n=1 Tax=Mucilaginibacter pineti TaxID=1391627 RepID=UPI000B857EE2|nr:hypothetical protein [Mucilaginibacter pineti]